MMPTFLAIRPRLLILAVTILTHSVTRADDYAIIPSSVEIADTPVMYREASYKIDFTAINLGAGSTGFSPVGTYCYFVSLDDPSVRYEAFYRNRATFNMPRSYANFPKITESMGIANQELFIRSDYNMPYGSYRLELSIFRGGEGNDDNPGDNTVVLLPSVEYTPTPDIDFGDATYGDSPSAVKAVGGPLQLDGGDPFSISVEFYNAGEAVDIPLFKIDYYLVPRHLARFLFSGGQPYHRFSDIDLPNALYLGRRDAAAFTKAQQQAGVASVTVTRDFILPTGLDILEYQVAAVLDPGDDIFEAGQSENAIHLLGTAEPTIRIIDRENGLGNYLNDPDDDPAEIFVRDVHLRPDYQPDGLATMSPNQVPGGDLVTITGNVTNASNFGSSTQSVILFTLQRSGGSGNGYRRVIGTGSLPGIPAGSSLPFSVPLQLPTDLTGDYFVNFEIDHTDLISERIEFNNRGISSFSDRDELLTILPPERPDLVSDGTMLVLPASTEAGKSVQLQTKFKNAGFSTLSGFTIRYVIAADPKRGFAEQFLGSLRINTSLAAGTSVTVTPSFTLPVAAQLPSGQYRVTALLDSLDEHLELDETNNLIFPANSGFNLSIEPTIVNLPNLQIGTSTPAGGSPRFGSTFDIVVEIANKGEGVASDSKFSMALSRNDILGDGDDIGLGLGLANSINPDDGDTQTFSATMPSGVPAGGYRLFIIADALGGIDESQETDNVTSIANFISLRPAGVGDNPELEITETFLSPGAGFAGGLVRAYTAVANVGKIPAGGFTLEYFLSPDPTIGNGNDTLIGSMFFDQLDNDDEFAFEQDLTIPANLPPGAYTFAWVLDRHEMVPGTPAGGHEATGSFTVLELGEPLLAIEQILGTRDILSVTRTEDGVEYFLQTSTDMTNWVTQPDPIVGSPTGLFFFEAGGKTAGTRRRYFRLLY